MNPVFPILIAEDNSVSRKLLEKVLIISITDPLTGCYNRAFMTQYLSQEIQKAKRYRHAFSLILCDIDKFKSINDTYGHQTEEASPETLISRADKCLYEAKEKGRNSVSSPLNGEGVRGG